MNALGIILMQVIAMVQPEAIVSTGDAAIVAVELAREETRVRLQCLSEVAPWTPPPTAYLSDETRGRHALRRAVVEDRELVLAFEPVPASTRVFDLIADDAHRWLGVHSGVRALHFPATRPQFDEDAKIADSIAKIIHENALVEQLADADFYASVKTRLPLLRDYIAWKWKLTPHEVFVLAREMNQNGASPNSSPAGNGSHTATRSLSSLPAAPKEQGGLLSRLFKKKGTAPPPSAAVEPRKVRPLSRFEQKMLQEQSARK